ncbi:sulfurtransferase [uncultured Tateyamaria sp.]|uniref:sulfurtransferase n=1 Tax=uncultured Tateyamaria sp. TaxID=455651 RepID=UPI002632314F|nr:sulfurtransferase [uncultured Tateyamaria sp.]
MNNLASAQWLFENQNREDVVILDCSVSPSSDDNGKTVYHSGKAQFDAGHIPGAQHADLVGALAGKTGSMLFQMPDAEQFRDEMQRLGVHDGATVVLYDQSFTAWAARVWWMLRWIGFDNAFVLNGGLKAWTDAGYAISEDTDPPVPGMLSLALRPDVIARQSDVRTSLDDPQTCLIDTLSAESFQGENNAYARPGHIAGASNVFALSMFKEDGTFKSKDDLQAMYDGAPDQRQITYCGAGILASATAFVLVQLGYEDVSVYAASLQEWAADPDNPMSVKDG